jgi:hypothetical protein
MANDKTNSMTVMWDPAGVGANAAIGKLRDVSPADSATEIEISVIGDAEKVFEAGQRDTTVEIVVVGIPAIPAIGDKGTLAITANDAVGTTYSYTNRVCTKKDTKGPMDGIYETTLSFKKSTSG